VSQTLSPRGTLIAIDALRFGFSPRFAPEDEAHVAALSETIDRVPPILVLRDTNEVIDGVHRTLAAAKVGRREIAATYFDGTPQDAFVQAVGANVTHGKPLTLAEREAAAARILRDDATWSDRRLAGVCGLSPTSVARIRHDTNVKRAASGRVGRDGRRRPEDPGDQRRRIAETLRRDPSLSLRKVATAVGASPATVLDVRDRLRRGEDPLPQRLRTRRKPPPDAWRADTALASVSRSAEFASWFDRGGITDKQWERFLSAIPVNRLYQVIDEVERRAACWGRFAAALNERAHNLGHR
jgi:hypothetical protein